ncbi:MAG: hypothetical protein ACI97A_000279 [Planctomycetota bacterium]|jgi:hypothetical protein
MNNLKTTCAGVFVLGASIILYEIALTRVFAIMMWHHFTYMVVSIALLGFGAAGSILTGQKIDESQPTAAKLSNYSLLFALSSTLSFCFVTLIRIDTLHLLDQPKNLIALLLFYILISVPMLFGGLAIGVALMSLTKHVNRIYFADLAGSALGGGVSALLLGKLGAETTIILVGAFSTVAALIFSLGLPLRRRILPALGFVVAAWFAIGFLGGAPALKIPSMTWEVPFAPDKEMTAISKTGVMTRLPSATAEVEVSFPYPALPIQGGEFSLTTIERIQARFVTQDGTAPTMLYGGAGDLKKFPFLRDTQAATGFVAREASGQKEPEVLVIGVGGGVDIMMSLAYNAKEVTAVEINPAMHRMVTEDFDEYLDGLFRPGAHEYSDRINLVYGEGRSYMRHSEKKFDVIQMSGVDSFTALSTGAYTLSESYLYTVEAVQEFFNHLTDGGVINYSRFILSYPKKPRETLRLAGIARLALEELGVEDPSSHICVFRGRDWASTMIKKTPFTRTEIEALYSFALKNQFGGLIYDPLMPADAKFDSVATSPDAVSNYIKQALRLHIPELDKNFDIDGVAMALADATLNKATNEGAIDDSILDELITPFPENLRPRAKVLARTFIRESRTYLSKDMESFNLSRRDFADLLSRDPKVRDGFIAGYPYEMEPCRDDNPFFFNYYKWSSLLSYDKSLLFAEGFKSNYHPDFPVGHAVLAVSMIQIGLLAMFLIFLPIRRLKRNGVPTPGRWRYLIYFASLGLGFMFIEITLMQKLVIFLGHPTYALSVVLSSLLGFAGLGSFLAGRIKVATRGVFLLLLVAILAAIGIELLAFQYLLETMLGASFTLRVITSVLLLLPLGLALGTAFPTGLRAVEANCKALVPWAWAVNGFMSVMASVLCIVLSQEIGFTKVFWLAAGIYTVGFLIVVPEKSGRRSASREAVNTDADQDHQEGNED